MIYSTEGYSFDCRPERYDIDVLLSNSRDRKIVKKMSPGDSSLRTGSIWLASLVVVLIFHDIFTGHQVINSTEG